MDRASGRRVKAWAGRRAHLQSGRPVVGMSWLKNAWEQWGWGETGCAGEPYGQELSLKALLIWDSPWGSEAIWMLGSEDTPLSILGRKPCGQSQGSSCFRPGIKSFCFLAENQPGALVAAPQPGLRSMKGECTRPQVPILQAGPLSARLLPWGVARHLLPRGRRGAGGCDGAPLPCAPSIRRSH